MSERTDDPRRPGPRRRDKASLGGETVEPRILLSTTWIWGTSGNDVMVGTNADETIDASAGNDVIDGGGGTDIVSYAAATGAVHVDLTVHTAQDTVGGGIDTLTNVEGVEGGSHDDVFVFSSPVDGATYTVAGGGGNDTIDLSGFAASAITFGDHSLTVDLGGGHAFHVNYDTVESIQFGDVGATVLTGDYGLDGYTGSHVFLEGDNAFRLDIDNAAKMSWSYAAATNTLSVLGTTGATGSTAIHIDDLNTDALVVDHLVVNEKIANLDCATDIGDLDVQATAAPDYVTVNGGAGTIGHLHGNNFSSSTVVDASVDKLEYTGHLSGTLELTGDVGSATIDKVTGSVVVHGSLGSLHVNNLNGTITVDGTVGTIDVVRTNGSALLSAANYAGDINADYKALKTATTSLLATTTTVADTTAVAVVDTAPVADAGLDVTIDENRLVMLDASASADPEGQPLTYLWTQVSGPTVVLDDATAAQPTFTAPEGLANTDVKFLLTVSDGTSIGYDTVVVTVNATDDAPVADAGLDVTVREGAIVSLSAAGSSDPEGQPLTYSWVQTSGTPVVLTGSSTDTPTFTAPQGLANSDLTFVVRVSDGVNTSLDTVTVHVNATNDAPTADAGADQVVNENDVVTLSGARSSDPEGQTLTYTWTQISGPRVTLLGTAAPVAAPVAVLGASYDSVATDGTVRFVAPEGLVNTAVKFQLTVSDGTTRSTDTVVVNINADNDAVTVDAGADQTVAAGDPITLTATAHDPENQMLTYTWTQLRGPAATIANGGSAQPTITAPEATVGEAMVFQVAVSDGVHTTVDTVTLLIGNAAPDVAASATTQVDSGALGVLTAAATDANHDGLTYRWTQVAGPSASLQGDGNAQATFVAPTVATSTELRFQVAVSDGTVTTTQIVSVVVDPPAAVHAPAAETVTETPPTTTGTANETPVVTTEAEIIPGGGGGSNGGGETGTGGAAGGGNDPLVDPFAGSSSSSEGESGNQPGASATNSPSVSDGRSDHGDEESKGGGHARETTADSEAGNAAQGDPSAPVVVATGTDVEITPTLPVPANVEVTYTWTQLSGSAVTMFDAGSRALRFEMPQSFTAEELVFQVEMQIGDEIVVQEVTVQIEPVAGEAKGATQAGNEHRVHLAADDGHPEESRGVGKIWASLFAFGGAIRSRR